MLQIIPLWGGGSLILLVLLYSLTQYLRHWLFYSRCGVPYFGAGFKTMCQVIAGSISMVQVDQELYPQAVASGSPLVGLSEFMFTGKTVYVTDLDLLKSIMAKDFEHFPNHRPLHSQVSNLYMRKMLFFMEDGPWKAMRAKLTPSFSTAKIKKMFDIFAESADRLSSYLKTHVGPAGSDFDLDMVMGKLAMDVISSSAFGVDSKCFSVPPEQSAELELLARKFQLQLNFKEVLNILLILYAPKVADLLGLELFDGRGQEHFAEVVKSVLKHRSQTGQRRNDFLQLMLDTQAGEHLEDDEGGAGASAAAADGVMDDDDIIANCMLFLMGGFDTTLSLLLFSVYALAMEPEVEAKVSAEVKAVLDKNNGALSYEGIQEMSYLDLFLNETLRFYPANPRTDRVCTKSYTIPGTTTVIEKGTIVVIPIYPIHHDPQNYTNPEKFDPDRFLPENKASRHAYAYMPFGLGPRSCIGMRFALIEVKAVIAKLVYNFKFGRCGRTMVPIEFAPTVEMRPKEGMWLRVTPRDA